MFPPARSGFFSAGFCAAGAETGAGFTDMTGIAVGFAAAGAGFAASAGGTAGAGFASSTGFAGACAFSYAAFAAARFFARRSRSASAPALRSSSARRFFASRLDATAPSGAADENSASRAFASPSSRTLIALVASRPFSPAFFRTSALVTPNF